MKGGLHFGPQSRYLYFIFEFFNLYSDIFYVFRTLLKVFNLKFLFFTFFLIFKVISGFLII